MKILFFPLYALIFLFTGCSKKNSAITNASAIADQLVASKWAVHYFYYISADQTNQYASYLFTFKRDSLLNMTNSTESYAGKWYTQKLSDGSIKLSIDYMVANMASQLLNNDWKVTSNDGTLLILTDYSPAINKELHFIRQ